MRHHGLAPAACGSASIRQMDLRQLLRPSVPGSQTVFLPDSRIPACQTPQRHLLSSPQSPLSTRHAPPRRVPTSGSLRPFTEAPLVYPGGAATAPPPPSFVDGDLRVPERGASAGGVSQSGAPEEDWGADERQSDIIFVGTGTSEGVPRVSCLTNPNKACPVSGRLSCILALHCAALHLFDIH